MQGPTRAMHENDPPATDVEADGDRAGESRKPRRPELTPEQRALALLVRREHSRKELNRKLAARGVQAEDARAAVDRMTAEGWQNDSRFAEQLVRSRAGAGYGPVRIRAELATHGLDRDAVAAAVDGYDGDWTENARSLVRRRFAGKLDDRDSRRKASEFLIRRGFGTDQVRAATRYDPDDDS